MAVPNTTTFSLQDVVNEVNPTTNDLVDCFNDSIAGWFDPSYSGSTNQLDDFRNYGPKLVTSSILAIGSPSGSSDVNVYEFDPVNNTYSYVYVPQSPSDFLISDIAHTSTKLYLYQDINNDLLAEWDITLSPFNATYNRTISGYPSSAGLTTTTTGNTMISVSGISVWESDITTTASTNTFKFNGITGRTVTGDYILTTTNKFIVLNNTGGEAGGTKYITQYNYPDGTMELDILLTGITAPYGLYEYDNELYINDSYDIFKIDLSSPYNITYVSTNTIHVGGTSQIASLLTSHFTATTLTEFLISSTGGASAAAGCALTSTVTAYHDGVGSRPQLGDFVYSDSGGTTPYDTKSWWKNDDIDTIKLGTGGEVVDSDICI